MNLSVTVSVMLSMISFEINVHIDFELKIVHYIVINIIQRDYNSFNIVTKMCVICSVSFDCSSVIIIQFPDDHYTGSCK